MTKIKFRIDLTGQRFGSYSCMAWEWINEEDVGGRCMLIPIPEEARGMPYAQRVMRQYSRIDG